MRLKSFTSLTKFFCLMSLLLVGCKQSVDASETLDAALDAQVADWIAPPTQADIARLLASGSSYSDYSTCTDKPKVCDRSDKSGKMQLPGKAILLAMRSNQAKYSTPGQVDYMKNCLTTGYPPRHWNDIQIHYYCSFSYDSKVRQCYSGALVGLKKLRVEAFQACIKKVAVSPQEAVVSMEGTPFKDAIDAFELDVGQRNQAELFQYIMFAATWAFDEVQTQKVINAFYDVQNAADPASCAKRPLRTEDLNDGKHCLADKEYKTGDLSVRPVGR